MKGKPILKALLFDFDGVILESVDVKTDVFRALFKPYPTHLPAIVRYHLKNSGVNRLEKFDYIYKYILRRPLLVSQKKKLATDFAALVFKKVLSCPMVRGAASIIKTFHKKLPLYIISATPEKELKEIIRQRGLSRFFKKVYGHPTTKTKAIEAILCKESWSPREVLYVGDARADWEAARDTGVQFVGRKARESISLFPKSIRSIHNLNDLRHLLFIDFGITELTDSLRRK